ncbi:Ig-like domain-containing protein [Paenibacillus sp. LjRoot56]|uniref:Ig-like domain-containing protein n=1 Tax=Paenibacillus sp. LjRoot56 TaxID=3342333 RepID=UPI003ED14C21
MHTGIAIKSRKVTALLLAILMICAPIVSMPETTLAAGATSYYVDGTNGSDTNVGSVAAPFKTIQKAASVAIAGDEVQVKAGVYRETVTPASNNVTFKNFGSDKVIISGGDLVTGWTETADAGVFEANVSWNFDSGNGNIAFFTDSTGNPVSMSPARFPYIKDSELLVKSKYGKFVSATNVDVDPSGTVNADGQFLTYDNEYVRGFTGMTTNAWTGALVYASSNNGFSAQTGEVLSNTADKITFKWPLSGYTPKSFGVASGMYLSNSYQALKLIAGAATKPSNAAVWYKDVAAGKLYVYLTDASATVINPSSGQVEFKNRENVFNLEGLSNITIQGINIRSAGVNFKNSHDNTFKGAVIEKVDSYNKLFTMSVLTDGLTKSFELDGYNNTVRDCEIKDMYGYGIKMLGHDNKVINNNIHDVDLFGYYQDGVGIYGYNQLVSHNEIYNVGRAAIGGKFQSSVIQYNKMHDTMKISYDGGIIYLVNHDFDGSEIHHNILYDVPNSANVEGIYPDNVSGNLKVYDNIIYNTKVAMLFNTPNERMTIVNNTIHNSKDNSLSSWGDPADQLETFGTVIIGNIFGGSFASQSASGAVEQYNTTGTNAVIGAIFVDPANGDFRLKTPEQYRSIEIPGVTDGHTSGFAVQGAVQPGAVWTAGYDIANASNINPTFQLKKLPYQQLLKNGGFVDGLDKWTTVGSPSIISHNAWDFRNGGQKAQGMLIKDGYTGAVLQNDEQISQTVTVKPNTKYTASLWGKVMGERRYYSDAIPVTPATAPDSFSFRNSEGAFIAGSSVTLKFPDVEFATGVDKVMFGTASETTSAGKIEMYNGDPANGKLMASQTLGSNVGWGYRAINNLNLANVPVGGESADIYLKFTNTNTAALARTCMFMDFVVFKQTPVAASDYLELGITGLATNPPVKQATASTFGVAGATARPTHSVSFTTGPNDTSLTYYVKKSGTNNLRGYIDELGLSEDAATAPVYPAGSTYFNGFEDSWHPANWTWGLGTPLLDATIKSEGNYSYKLDGSVDKNAVYKVLSSSYAKVAKVDFYDDMAAGNKSLIAHVDSSGATNFDKIASMYGAGIHTANSATNYSITLGTGVWQTSTVPRTPGWHTLTFDYSSGTGVDMYIDQVWVGYSNKAISFNTIALGDFFTGENSTGNFDNVNVVDTTPLKGPLDVTVPNNLTVGTALTTDNSAVVNFAPKVRGGNNPQISMTVSNALGTNQPFTSGGSLPVGLSTMTVTVTAGATVITKTFFVNVIQTYYFDNFENDPVDISGGKANTTNSANPTLMGPWKANTSGTAGIVAATPATTNQFNFDGYSSFGTAAVAPSNDGRNLNAINQTQAGWDFRNKIVTAWYYDADPTAAIVNQVLQVKSSTAPANSWFLGQYYNTAAPVQGSTSQYSVRAYTTALTGKPNNQFIPSGTSRTAGWHQLKIDFTPATTTDMYIDGTRVRQEPRTTEVPNYIALGDLWENAISKAVTTYWDNVAVTTSLDTMGPTITPSASTTTYFADTTGVAVDSDITFTDMDTTIIPDDARVMVSILDGFKSAEDVLQLTNVPSTMGDIASSYDATAGILTLSSASGATAAQWQAALQAVQYKNNLATPTVSPRGLSFVGYDGINLGNAVAKTVVISLNTAPTVSNTTIATPQNTVANLTAINFGFNDLDGDALASIKILTLPAHGTLKLSGTAVVADQVVLASNFANFTYTPATDYVGADVFTWNGFDGNRYATSGAAVEVNVTAIPVTSVTLDQSTLSLVVGGQDATLVPTINPVTATNKNVIWHSSDLNVATVVNGVVHPVSAGAITITATTADGGFTATSTVTVAAAAVPVTGISLDITTTTLTVGGSDVTLTPTITPINATNKNVTWSSSNPSVATVSNGVVHAIASGTTTITVTTVDGGHTATSLITVINQGAQLTGPASVLAGEALHLTYGLVNVTENVYAQDFTVKFDAGQLQFVSAESLVPGFSVVGESDVTGEVRILAASTGSNSTVAGTMDVLKLNFQTKLIAQTVISRVYLTDVVVADVYGVETPLNIDVVYNVQLTVPVVDKTELNAKIAAAQAKVDTALISSTRWGHYSQSVVDALKAVISNARTITNNANATQSQTDQAVINLDAAMVTFAAAVNTTASIGDLALLARNYGATSVRSDWNMLQMYDLNHDNKLDLIDLVALARKILGQ